MNKSRRKSKRSEDAELLTKFVLNRDEEAIAALVRKYEKFVWNVCCRLLDDRCDAEDAFQATFMLLATRARRIRKPGSLSSWLYGVAFRTASSIRKQRHRSMLPYKATIDSRLEQDVLEQVTRKNENELVSAELMLLQERYKTPLLMFYFLGKSSSQIGNSLGISVTAVESRLRQAKKVLKQRLRMRGIDFNQCCMALAVPMIAISPKLSISTIDGILAASVARDLTAWASNVYSTIQKSGAKLVFMKTVISLGLVGILSIGMISNGLHGSGGTTTVVGSQATASVLPIKFVNDDEDSNEEESTLHRIHNHLYSVWSNITSHFHEEEDEEIVIDLKIDDQQDQNYTYKVIAEIEFDEEQADASKTFSLVTINDEVIGDEERVIGVLTRTSGSELHVNRDISFLSSIPIVGRLFESVESNEEVVLGVPLPQHTESSESSVDEDR